MRVFRTVIFFPLALIRLLSVVFISAVTGLCGMVLLKLSGFSRTLQRRVLHFWGKTVLAVCGIKVIYNQLPGNEQFILMSNHRSYLDVVVLAAYIPASFVAKSEVLSWPLMKTASKVTNIIFVSRQEQKSLLSAMKQIKASVTRGIPVAVFPEGTTSKGPLTRSFKKGSFKIAVDSAIPVIPAAIHFEDINDAWVDDDTFVGHFFRQMGKPVTRVHLRFGNAITGTDVKELREVVKAEIDSMLQAIVDETHMAGRM